MTLRDDMLNHDLDTVFFNTDEHAEDAVYFPLGDTNNPQPIVVLFDSIVLDDDIINDMSEGVFDSIPRAEAKQKDIPEVDDEDRLFRVATETMYKISNYYYNDNGTVELHLTKVRRHGA